ncbi:MAG: MauE/DoxX family redox-associated membrane protein [Waddliaceae bacterium]
MKDQKAASSKKISDYFPLIALICVALFGALAICYSVQGGVLRWMHYFMGLIFMLFALLKLFDISGFADGFQRYDLIAKRSRYYALSYPFIELLLGLGYLSMWAPVFIYIITIILMLIGSLGVILGLKKGLDIYCPCMGTVLKVPLSTVTLTEDLGMGISALIMLIIHFS